MAVTMQVVYDLASYTIVDLSPAGRLQRRYISEILKKYRSTDSLPSLAPHRMNQDKRNNLTMSIRCIDATQAINSTSDLVVSFFSIAEQKKSEVKRYVEQYMVHSPRGYLQLNYDEAEHEALKKSGGALGHMYSVFEIFKLVYAFHPTAVFLGSPSIYENPAGSHHRIVWGSPKYGAYDSFFLNGANK